MPHRRMADPAFLGDQRARLHDSRTAPITIFIDRIRGDRFAPYVAPLHGGIESRMLSILRDPGPKTTDSDGSGMLCIENDDPSAELQAEMADAAGVEAADFLPWNAYPWYFNRKPNAAEMREGTAPIIELVGLLPKLEVVFLQGAEAQQAWKLALKAQPDLARLKVVATFHPGRQALFHPEPEERARRAANRVTAWKEVGAILAASRTEVDA